MIRIIAAFWVVAAVIAAFGIVNACDEDSAPPSPSDQHMIIEIHTSPSPSP